MFDSSGAQKVLFSICTCLEKVKLLELKKKYSKSRSIEQKRLFTKRLNACAATGNHLMVMGFKPNKQRNSFSFQCTTGEAKAFANSKEGQQAMQCWLQFFKKLPREAFEMATEEASIVEGATVEASTVSGLAIGGSGDSLNPGPQCPGAPKQSPRVDKKNIYTPTVLDHGYAHANKSDIDFNDCDGSFDNSDLVCW